MANPENVNEFNPPKGWLKDVQADVKREVESWPPEMQALRSASRLADPKVEAVAIPAVEAGITQTYDMFSYEAGFLDAQEQALGIVPGMYDVCRKKLELMEAQPYPTPAAEAVAIPVDERDFEWARNNVASAPITPSADALVEALGGALDELYAQVKGECPSLLNGDSGGDAVLDLRIDAALTAYKEAKSHA